MRAVLLAVVSLVALAMATQDIEDIKQRQILILKLLLEPQMYNFENVGKNFDIEKNINRFTKPDVVKQFIKMLKVGYLPRGEIFTLHVDRQMKEVVTMFHMLYYAKDFNIFIRIASWMRVYLNEGMFVYALSVAVRHREDCRGIILPPPYEIYPYYFVRADVIQKAYLLKMKRGQLDPKLSEFYGIKKTHKDVYIIDENIYDKRVYLSNEDKLRYFTEDIDLNTYFYYFHVDYPFWMKDSFLDERKIRRFELTVYTHQQILARYYLERLSNGLGKIKELSWHMPIKNGYWPWLKLHNGVQLPVRFNNYVIARDDNLEVIRLADEYEKIIREAIIKGFIEVNGVRFELTKAEDVELLGKLIFGEIDQIDIDKTVVESYRYLLIVMNAALGLNTFNTDKYFVVPSVLDQYQTALRDPVFYMLQKRIIDLVLLFKLRLPSYTKEELYFPGVKIDNVVVDQLVTYFDDYLMDMTSAVPLTEQEIKNTENDLTLMVRKRRLNHQPFKVTFDISSDKSVDCVVRLFLGPKKDHMGRLIDIETNRLNFVELDSFAYVLNTGKNTIVRNSYDMHNLVHDRIFTRDLIKKLESSITSIPDIRNLLVNDLRNYHTGFPTRLLLPKGSVGGMHMMLYVIVTPLKLDNKVDINILDMDPENHMQNFRSTVLLDKMPLGFPFDRRFDVSNFFTPNMKFVDVTIFHKKMMCDMKTRWNRWVLKNYNMDDRTSIESDTYFVDLNIKVDRNESL